MTRSPIVELLLVVGIILVSFYLWLSWNVPARAGETCGTASFYGAKHHGRTMANGQPFNMHALTAAMWGPKFGTVYRVRYGDKSVIVTITDRGPAKRLNRLIDLSQASFAKLAPLERGVLKGVCLERVG